MFEKIRQSFRDSLGAAGAPEDRRRVVAEMKETLVRARLGLDDLRGGVDQTRERLRAEERELATVQRRRALAEGIGDQETVAVAAKYELHVQEKVDVQRRKLEAQEAELAIVEGEVTGMTRDFKVAAAGGTPVGAGAREANAAAELDRELEGDPLRDDLDSLGRQARRAERESSADAMLDALKRRMGK